MNRPSALAALCAAAFLVAPALAGASDPKPVVVKLDAMNGSNESGTATFTPKGEKTVVTIDLANGPKLEQPAHFHMGTCDKYTPRHEYNLENVVEGKSNTTLDVPMSKLVGGDMVINVHKSKVEVATISSCAIIKS